MNEEREPSHPISDLEALWGPRRGPPPGLAPFGDGGRAPGDDSQGDATDGAAPQPPLSATPQARDKELEKRLLEKLAELERVVHDRHRAVVESTTAELAAVREHVQSVLAEQLASSDARSAESQANVQRHIDALAQQATETSTSMAARIAAMEEAAQRDKARLIELAEAQRTEMTELGADLDVRMAAVEARVATAAAETAAVAADQLTALRAFLRDEVATVTASVQDLQNDVDVALAASLHRARAELADVADAHGGRLERLEDELADSVREGIDGVAALQRQLDVLGSEVAAAAGHVAKLGDDARERVEVALARASDGEEALEARLRSDLLEAVRHERAEAASEADLTALKVELQGLIAKEGAGAREQLDSRIAAVDALVTGLDAAMEAVAELQRRMSSPPPPTAKTPSTKETAPAKAKTKAKPAATPQPVVAHERPARPRGPRLDTWEVDEGRPRPQTADARSRKVLLGPADDTSDRARMKRSLAAAARAADRPRHDPSPPDSPSEATAAQQLVPGPELEDLVSPPGRPEAAKRRGLLRRRSSGAARPPGSSS